MRLQVPPDPSYGIVVRGVVAAFASLADPSIDELDDIRLATQEAFVAVMEGVIGAEGVDVDISSQDRHLTLAFVINGAVTGLDEDGLSMKVLRAVSQEVSCQEDAGSRSLQLTLSMKGASA